MATTLIVPGLHGSGPTHWQSWWEAQTPNTLRVEQADWATPELTTWSAEVGKAIDRASSPVWIVAHSFGCLASIKAASTRSGKVAGLFLVAPADPVKFQLTQDLPSHQLAIPSFVLASSNDPWMRQADAKEWAARWGSRFVDLGPAGHVNPASGFGPWEAGLELFQDFVEGNDPRTSTPRKSSFQSFLIHP